MMRRMLLLIIEVSAVFVLFIAVGLFWAAYYVDTDEFRQEFTTIVERLTGQSVLLKGELDIALYPVLSLKVYDLSLLGKSESPDTPLMRFQSLRVSARLLPLASNRLEIRTIVVRGMELNLICSKDGEYNWQSLPGQSNATGDDGGVGFFDTVSLEGLEVVNATVFYTDNQDGQRLGLTGVALRTGAIVSGGDIPFTAKSNFIWKNQGVESELTLKGMVVSDHASGNISLKNATGYASIGGPFLPKGAIPGQITANIGVDWDNGMVSLENIRVHFLGLRGEGALLSGDLSKGISGKGHLTISPFKPVDIVKRYYPKVPVKSVDGLKEGAFTSIFQFDEKGFSLTDMAAVLDDMTVRGSIAMKGYSRPAFSFDLRGDIVDLDRYLPLFRTDTPFVWNDFQLDVFRVFRGNGRIVADTFKLVDTLLSDVRVSVKADGKVILVDAGAFRKGQGALGGNMEFVFGQDQGGNIPTLALNAKLTAESQKSGFELLNTDRLGLTGAGLFKADIRVASMPCPPEARSINILRYTTVDSSLHMGAGLARFVDDKGKAYQESYSTAAIVLKAFPLPVERDGFYGFKIDSSFRGEKGKAYDLLSLVADGPILWGVDDGQIASSGLAVKTQLAGRLYADVSDRLSVSGKLAFDSAGKLVEITDATVRTLETTVKGNARVDGTGDKVKATGKLEITGANVRRIIYLLARKRLDLNDVAALKTLSLTAGYVISDTGFTLNEVQGDLDGMAFDGLVVGQGLKNPKLTFTLSAGVFDLDRYLPRSEELTLAEIRAGKQMKKASPVDLPLSFLRRLRLSGKAAFEEFKLADIRTRPLTGMILAEKGDIRILSAKGEQYGGVLTGELTGKIEKDRLTTHLLLHVENMQAGPLLKDIVEREYVKGESDIDVDLTSFGVTDDDIVKNLDGKCRVRVRNGSFKFSGYDVASTSEPIGSENMGQVGKSQRQSRTVFQKAMVDFTVKKGVFNVDKFRVESPPLLQSYGSGWFNLPDDTIKLSVRNDFLAVPSVTLDIVGKLSDPEVKVPKGKIVNDTVRNILSLPEKSFKFLRDLFL